MSAPVRLVLLTVPAFSLLTACMSSGAARWGGQSGEPEEVFECTGGGGVMRGMMAGSCMRYVHASAKPDATVEPQAPSSTTGGRRLVVMVPKDVAPECHEIYIQAYKSDYAVTWNRGRHALWNSDFGGPRREQLLQYLSQIDQAPMPEVPEVLPEESPLLERCAAWLAPARKAGAAGAVQKLKESVRVSTGIDVDKWARGMITG